MPIRRMHGGGTGGGTTGGGTDKLTQAQILQRLGVPESEWRFLEGNSRGQQYLNQLAARKGLPGPFDPSVASAIVQDVLPLATPFVFAGGVAAGGTESAAAAGVGAEEAATAEEATTLQAIRSTAGKAALLGASALAIQNVTDFLKFISWLFHPMNILRAVEFLVGMALIIVGLKELMNLARRSSATHRTSITGSIRSLFGKTPVGRAQQVSRARKRGKRAGELQAERDVAYRGARQQRARSTGAKPRTTPGSGGTGGTGQGSSALE